MTTTGMPIILFAEYGTDAIYQVTPSVTALRIALCGSLRYAARDSHRRRLSVRRDYNDDACGLQWKFCPMNHGQTYYIIVMVTQSIRTYRLHIEYVCVDGMSADLTECAEVIDTVHAAVDCNGGPCNANWGGTPQYQTISCGQSIRSRSFTTISPSGGHVRDTDWYRFTVAQPGTAIFTMTGEFEGSMQAGSFPPTGCDFYPNYTFGSACAPLTLNMDCPTAGDYFIFAAVNGFSGMDFLADYHLSLECVPYFVPYSLLLPILGH
jgi:hypothetical protein